MSAQQQGLKVEWQRDPIELKGRQYSIGIEWDELGSAKMDLDLQAVIVDNHGTIIDAVYYNNLESLNGAIGSQGDAQDGDSSASGMDEVIWLNLSKVPAEIHLIIFVVAAYGGRSLKEVDNGKIILSETVNSARRPIGKFHVENACADADIVGMIRRTREESWCFIELEMPAELGSHFLDILEPQIGDVIRHEIPHAPKHQNVSFQMMKGSDVHFQGAHCLKRLSISLDADVNEDATEAVDMDISAVFYGEDHQLLGSVDSVNEAMFGVGHSGESHYEHHEHIQESLSIDLHQMPEKVKHIFIVLTIQHGSFKGVQNVHMHVADQDAQDVASMIVPAGHKESGLIVARIYDTNSRLTKRWALCSHEKFFSHGGTSWHTDECKKEMAHLLHEIDHEHDHDQHHQHTKPHQHSHKKHIEGKASSEAKGTKTEAKSDKKSTSSAPAKRNSAAKMTDKKKKVNSGAAIAPKKQQTVPPELTPEVSASPQGTSPRLAGSAEAPSKVPASNSSGVLRKKGGIRTQVTQSLATPRPEPALVSAPESANPEKGEVSAEQDPKLPQPAVVVASVESENPNSTCEIVQVAFSDEAEPQKDKACAACSWTPSWWCQR